MKLSLVIPCYNEAENIKLIVSRLQEVIGERTDIEVILVDNGSTDDSQERLMSELQTKPATIFKQHHVPVNQGYGYGILSGLEQASGDVFAWTHADMQTDPMDVLNAFDLYVSLNNDNIIIKGKRKNRKLIELMFTFCMQIAVFVFLRKHLSDINAQPKLFSRNFYEVYLKNKAPYDFSLDLYMLYVAKANGYKILTIPVYFANRMHGEAKGGGGSTFKTRIKLIKRTIEYVIRLSRTL